MCSVGIPQNVTDDEITEVGRSCCQPASRVTLNRVVIDSTSFDTIRRVFIEMTLNRHGFGHTYFSPGMKT